MKQLIIFSFFLIQTLPTFAAPSDELHVEGVSYEAQNEATSIAVINGEFLKEGDSYSHYKIEKIGSNFVRVADRETNVQTELNITASASKIEPPKKISAALPVSLKNSKSGAKPSVSNSPSLFNLAAVRNKANEAAALAALRKINTAAQAYFYEEGLAGGITLEKLIKSGMISDIYAHEYKGYRFNVKSKGDNIQVFADPVTDGPEQRHFLIDGSGAVRTEQSRSATSQSPVQSG